MRIKISFLFCLVTFCLKSLVAQQLVTSNSFFEDRRFLFEVKQIDEFFERFNDEKDSFLRKNIGRYYPEVKITRPVLIGTLFDQKGKILPLERRQFIAKASNQSLPEYLDFYKPGWYAEVICQFHYKNQPVSVTVKMNIVSEVSGGAKWMINGLNCQRVKPYTGSLDVAPALNPSKFLSPMSHVTNFVGLARAFEDEANLRDFFHDSAFTDPSSKSVIYSLIRNELNFDYVRSVQYHFAQIPGWRFKVTLCANARSINNGWLITGLEETR